MVFKKGKKTTTIEPTNEDASNDDYVPNDSDIDSMKQISEKDAEPEKDSKSTNSEEPLDPKKSKNPYFEIPLKKLDLNMSPQQVMNYILSEAQKLTDYLFNRKKTHQIYQEK